jgi:acyl carrier protein
MMGYQAGFRALEDVIMFADQPQIVIAVGDLNARIDTWVQKRNQARPLALATRTRELDAIPNSLSDAQANLEGAITKVWEEVLGIDKVGLDDRFLDIGGDSLVAIQILTRIEEHFNVQLSLDELVQPDSTVRTMARHIEINLERLVEQPTPAIDANTIAQ